MKAWMRVRSLVGAALMLPLLTGALLVLTAGPALACTYRLDPGQYVSGFSSLCPGESRGLANGGEPDLGGPSELDSWLTTAKLAVGVGILAVGVAVGRAAFRARHRTSGD